jgi:UDP-N-acetylglucosamine--N-acetylmuramyl-(pentapeptide) pyrophosphoryl-undecaprenol N-acetylglucosamine transferase
LVLGGSLGAQQLNNYLPKIFEIVNKTKRITVIHQSGSKHYNDLINNYKKLNVEVDIIDFIHDMDKKYEWADLIIARSGALTVTEICEVGIASILIPYPYAVDNHQLFNAKIIEEKKGGYIIKQESMENDLMSLLIKITRKECLNMATNIRSKKRQNASQEILKHCMKVLAHEK